jgi:hypothetical protein
MMCIDCVAAPLVSLPVLILLDRNVDLAVMLQHTWTYQAMVHDLLSFDLNRVTVMVKDADDDAPTAASSQGKPQTYNLDDSSDSFWAQHKASPFTEMAGMSIPTQQRFPALYRSLSRSLSLSLSLSDSPPSPI